MRLKSTHNGVITERAFFFGLLEFLNCAYIDIPKEHIQLKPVVNLSEIKSWFYKSKPSYSLIRKFLAKKNPKIAIMEGNKIDILSYAIYKQTAYFEITASIN